MQSLFTLGASRIVETNKICFLIQMWILIIIIIFQLKTVAVSVCLTGVSLHSKSKKIYFSQIYIKHAKFSAKTFVQNNALIPEERICPSENKVQLILTLCHDVDTWKEKNVRPKYLSYLFSFFFFFCRDGVGISIHRICIHASLLSTICVKVSR